MTKQEHEKLARTLKAFPGASYKVERTSRHIKVVLDVGGKRASVIKSHSSGCYHAFPNFLGDVKRAVKALSC